MRRWSKAYLDFVSLAGVSLCIIIAGCASKHVAASSADASSTAKARGGGSVETIAPERMAAVPENRNGDAIGRAGSVQPSLVEQMPVSSAGNLAGGRDAGLIDIFFDFDKYGIRRDAQPALEADASWINKSSVKSIMIEGHCDERGTEAYNMVLGERRAQAAKRYLEDLGIPRSALQVSSFGKARPFCNDHNETCYQLNRRAHFVVQ